MTHATFELYRTISDDSLQELTDASRPFVARAHPLSIPKAAHTLILKVATRFTCAPDVQIR